MKNSNRFHNLRRMLAGMLLGALAVSLSACKPGAAPGGFGGVHVVAVPAEQRALTETLALIGDVVANEAVDIQSRTAGPVEEIGFEEGQRVKKNAMLFRIDGLKLAAMVAQKQASFDLAQKNAERSRALFADRTISQQEADQVAAALEVARADLMLAQQELQEATVTAPFGGIMGARRVSLGQVVARDGSLSTLADLDSVKIEFSVPERLLAQVRVGQVMTLRVPAYGERAFEGEVYFIAPNLDVETRTALVKARVQNDDLALKPGMLATLDLAVKAYENAVLIPEAGLMANDKGYSVFTVNAEQVVELRPVQIGLRQRGFVQIAEGLAQGEQVIVEGTQKVGPGVPVVLAPPEDTRPYALPAAPEIGADSAATSESPTK